MVLRESMCFDPGLSGLMYKWTFTVIFMFTSMSREGLPGDGAGSVSFFFSFSKSDSHNRFHASFQSLQKLFTTHKWKLDKTDKRQTKCIVSSLQSGLYHRRLSAFLLSA